MKKYTPVNIQWSPRLSNRRRVMMTKNPKTTIKRAIIYMVTPDGKSLPDDHPYIQMLRQKHGPDLEIRTFATEKEMRAAVETLEAELASSLAPDKGSSETDASTQQPEESPAVSWADSLKYRLKHCVQLPVAGVVAAITGKLPSELQRTGNDKSDKKLALLQHGLSHFMIGAVGPGRTPKWLNAWHEKLVDELDPTDAVGNLVEKFLQSFVHHMQMSAMSDAEIAKIVAEKMTPGYQVGSEPWEWCNQVQHRLLRANGGPISNMGEEEEEGKEKGDEKEPVADGPAGQEQGCEQKPGEGKYAGDVSNAVSRDEPPGSEPFVPTPADSEFDRLMQQMLTPAEEAKPVAPTDGPKKDGENAAGATG
jgi:hypothetical protein